MVLLPWASDEIVKVATPEPLRVTPPGVRSVAPCLKSTLPVGVPAPGATAVTVPVKVTIALSNDGSGDEVTVVVVLALLTTCGVAESLPELLLKWLSPP